MIETYDGGARALERLRRRRRATLDDAADDGAARAREDDVSRERAIPRRVSGPWKVEWADVASAAVSREIRNKDPTDLFVAMGLDTAAVEMEKAR